MSFLFFFFATLLIISASLVITCRNPVHSVFFLIFAFFNSSGLLILLGAEFVAMILLVVYVGAVVVLFLFVVMMLNVQTSDLRQCLPKSVFLGVLVGGLVFFDIYAVIKSHDLSNHSIIGLETDVRNTNAIGEVLYTQYFYPFQLVGVILLAAMVGAIVLTINKKPDLKRQSVIAQITRSSKIKKVDIK